MPTPGVQKAKRRDSQENCKVEKTSGRISKLRDEEQPLVSHKNDKLGTLDSPNEKFQNFPKWSRTSRVPKVVVDKVVINADVVVRAEIENPESETEIERARKQENEYDPDGDVYLYWPVHAIKTWLDEWSKQKPMATWTIDSYDGQGSHEALQLNINEKHLQERPLAPKKFHKTRETLIIAEYVSDNIYKIPDDQREVGWYTLKTVALSVCGDYVLEETQQRPPSDPLGQGKQKSTQAKRRAKRMAHLSQELGRSTRPRSRRDSEEEGNHMSGDQDERVDRNDSAMMEPLRSDAEGKVDTTQNLEKPHKPRSRSDSADEINHVSGDQDEFVDRNGRAMRSPLGSDAERQVGETMDNCTTSEVGAIFSQWGCEGGRHTGCFFKGKNKQRSDNQKVRGEDSDEEPERLVCNMTGQNWEILFATYYNRSRVPCS